MNNLETLLKYMENKFPIKERVYHKEFYVGKDKKNKDEWIFISICAWYKNPLIRIYNKGELIEELYMQDWKIRIDQRIENITDKIKLPNIDYVYEITKKILDEYTEKEIMVICFSDFYNISDLEDDIKYKVRDLKAKQKDYLNICKFVKLSTKEQSNRKDIENMLLDL